VRSGLVHRAPDAAGPLPSLLAQVTPSQRCADPLAVIWAAASERGPPARDELPCPTIEPGGPSRHAEASADQPRPGMPPDPTAGRRTLTVLTRPAGHRRRRVRNPTRQLPRAGGPDGYYHLSEHAAGQSVAGRCRVRHPGGRRGALAPGRVRLPPPAGPPWPPLQAEDVRSAVGWQ
jgi:hypothetical protein